MSNCKTPRLEFRGVQWAAREQLSGEEPDVDTGSAEGDQNNRVVSMPFELQAH